MNTLSRRNFLKAAAVLAAPTIIPISAIVRGRTAPGDRINLPLIGCGSRGIQVMRGFFFRPEVQVVAVCDVHDLHYRDQEWGTGELYGRDRAKQLVEAHYGSDKPSGSYK